MLLTYKYKHRSTILGKIFVYGQYVVLTEQQYNNGHTRMILNNIQVMMLISNNLQSTQKLSSRFHII